MQSLGLEGLEHIECIGYCSLSQALSPVSSFFSTQAQQNVD